ncbi:hypothetical protein J6590_042883 [Homalodisca vitripennis]|nr:hypothetical protein J6590_042883 [Homalodisca vitripennis]
MVKNGTGFIYPSSRYTEVWENFVYLLRSSGEDCAVSLGLPVCDFTTATLAAALAAVPPLPEYKVDINLSSGSSSPTADHIFRPLAANPPHEHTDVGVLGESF